MKREQVPSSREGDSQQPGSPHPTRLREVLAQEASQRGLPAAQLLLASKAPKPPGSLVLMATGPEQLRASKPSLTPLLLLRFVPDPPGSLVLAVEPAGVRRYPC